MSSIDSHVHVRGRRRFRHPWFAGNLALDRDFLPGDIDVETAAVTDATAGYDSPPARGWERALREPAHDPTVSVKISGLSSLAAPDHPLLPQIAPFLDIALDAFGPDRSMLGSDRPVSARLPKPASYGARLDTVLGYSSLVPTEELLLRSETASTVCRLPAHPRLDGDTR